MVLAHVCAGTEKLGVAAAAIGAECVLVACAALVEEYSFIYVPKHLCIFLGLLAGADVERYKERVQQASNGVSVYRVAAVNVGVAHDLVEAEQANALAEMSLEFAVEGGGVADVGDGLGEVDSLYTLGREAAC